ncbi:hypothetical protein [Streptomyces canus]|uniref:hypothetical protein n=1 Tax=Streptomyces canus TaxID=58343 RepID=UPI0039A60518
MRITAGATELEQRLADFLHGGLAGPERTTYATGSGDPEAARRRAAERWSVQITAGATKLKQRLTDLLHGGLAGPERAAGGGRGRFRARVQQPGDGTAQGGAPSRANHRGGDEAGSSG